MNKYNITITTTSGKKYNQTCLSHNTSDSLRADYLKELMKKETTILENNIVLTNKIESISVKGQV